MSATPCPTCNGTNTYNGQPRAEGVGVCIDPFHGQALAEAPATTTGSAKTPPTQPLNNLDELTPILDGVYNRTMSEAEAAEAIQRLITAARCEELDFTIDTDEQGDYIRFFDDREPIRGDKRIIRFMYDRLREAK